MPIKQTISEFINKAKKVHGEKYDYSKVNYITTSKTVIIICPEHGEFKQRPNSHLKGSGCSECVGNKKLNNDVFIKKSKKNHGEKYNYSLVEYKNTYTKVKIICPEHGIFEQTPKNHLRGCDCPKCSANFMDNEYFIEKAKKVHGEKYDYSKVNYEKNDSKLIIICPEHGDFIQSPNAHLMGCGCKKCFNNKLRTPKSNNNSFIEKAKKVHGEKYDYSKVMYYGSQKSVNILCPIHGEFKQTAYIHLSGSGCPICKESKGEKLIRRYLLEHNIKFEPQKKFDGCMNERLLPFDFYLNELNICIEYDGIQHFKPINIFGGLNGFILTKNNDEIKTSYCKENNIKLIRISYNDIKIIKNILNESLNA